MAVTIDIDIRAIEAQSKIEQLRAELATLDDDFDFNLDGDLGDTMDELAEVRSDLAEIEASLQNIDDLDDLDLDISGGGGGGGGGGGSPDPSSGSGGGSGPPTRDIARKLERRFDFLEDVDTDVIKNMDVDEVDAQVSDFYFDTRNVGSGGRRNLGHHGVPNWTFTDDDIDLKSQELPSLREMMHQRRIRTMAGGSLGPGLSRLVPDADLGALRQASGATPDASGRIKQMSRLSMTVGKLNQRIGGLKNAFMEATPAMRDWYKLIAVLLPLVIAFAVQALGAATAMLTLAGASATLVGLGLAGEGEDIGDAFENAGDKIRDFGNELFDALQPTMGQFTPITEEVLDGLPTEFTGAGLEALLAYEDDVYRMFAGIVDWFGDLAIWAGESRDEVSQLAFRFGDILGSGIIDFLDWLVTVGYENQEMLIELGQSLQLIGLMLYDVSEIVGRIVNLFQPLLQVFRWFTSLLRNDLGAALILTITLFGSLFVAGTKLMVMMAKLRIAMTLLGGTSALASFAQTGMIYLTALRQHIAATVASLGTLQAMLAATGVGLLAIGGGYLGYQAIKGAAPSDPPSGGTSSSLGGGQGGQAVVYQDNREYQIQNQGQMDNATEQRMRSTIQDWETEGTAMEPPSPGVGDGQQTSNSGSPDGGSN